MSANDLAAVSAVVIGDLAYAVLRQDGDRLVRVGSDAHGLQPVLDDDANDAEDPLAALAALVD